MRSSTRWDELIFEGNPINSPALVRCHWKQHIFRHIFLLRIQILRRTHTYINDWDWDMYTIARAGQIQWKKGFGKSFQTFFLRCRTNMNLSFGISRFLAPHYHLLTSCCICKPAIQVNFVKETSSFSFFSHVNVSTFCFICASFRPTYLSTTNPNTINALQQRDNLFHFSLFKAAWRSKTVSFTLVVFLQFGENISWHEKHVFHLREAERDFGNSRAAT